MEQYSAGTFRAQRVLYGHLAVKKHRRHHALSREHSEGQKFIDGCEGGAYHSHRLINTNFLSTPLGLGGLGRPQIDGLLADCAVSL